MSRSLQKPLQAVTQGLTLLNNDFAVHLADLKCLQLALRPAPKFVSLKPEETEPLKRQAVEVGLLFKYPQSHLSP